MNGQVQSYSTVCYTLSIAQDLNPFLYAIKIVLVKSCYPIEASTIYDVHAIHTRMSIFFSFFFLSEIALNNIYIYIRGST